MTKYFKITNLTPVFIVVFILMFYIPIFSNFSNTSTIQDELTPPVLDIQTSNQGFINETGQEVFWFIHITDLHIPKSNVINNFNIFLNDTCEIINPSFIINTGDLVNGINFGLTRDINQWHTYQNLLTKNNAELSYYIDLMGNHDVSANTDYTPFLQYSMLGSRIYDVNYSFTRNFSFGNYAFICLDTVKDDPYDFPYLDFGFDGFIYTDDLDWYESKLEEYKDYDNIFTFSHHPDASSRDYNLISELSSSKLSFAQLTDKYNVSCHISGHTHENHFEERNDVFKIETNDFKTAGAYRIIAMDHGEISTSIAKVGTWPQYVVTYPPSNKFAPNDFVNNENKIRILAWHPDGINSVKWSAYNNTNSNQITPWKSLSILNHDRPLWEGEWNSTLNGRDNYEIRVRVTEISDLSDDSPNNSQNPFRFIPIIIIGGILISSCSIMGAIFYVLDQDK